ncbi:MAG: hypothetical protein HYV34_00715 [Candidatus Kerfeldbacteria bacterium]|nr:hypothetical protein [Candidatus Kerfeldbacteria bacterium]
MAHQSSRHITTEQRVDGHRVLIATFLSVTVIGVSLILWWLSLRMTLAETEGEQEGVFGAIRNSFNEVKGSTKSE